jgi:FdhD protein
VPRAIQLTAFGPDNVHSRTDSVAIEAPLEVRLNGQPFAVIMRTPGDDEALALGFLLSESVIAGADDVADTVSWPGDPALGNRLNIVLTPAAADAEAAALAGRRRVTMSSACGLCGRVTIDSLRRDGAPIPVQWSVPTAVVHALPSRLRATQRGFDETGGVHAAGLFNRDGALVTSAEDVGRHNAVDKVVGRMLRERRLPLEDMLLAVSGRVSFEIVQKALIAGLPLIAAVSAPTSLAIECAQIGGLTLAAFVRGDRFNVYTHPERIVH